MKKYLRISYVFVIPSILVLIIYIFDAEKKASSTNYRQKVATAVAKKDKASIILAGGCFWCIEAVYDQNPAVLKAESGYIKTIKNKNPHHIAIKGNPNYDKIKLGTSNYIEAVKITYNRSKLSLKEILTTFWHIHDPTSLHQQGADVGFQYSSAIFYHSKKQLAIIKQSKKQAQEELFGDKKIMTYVEPAGVFYPAEREHQDFYNRNKSGYNNYRSYIKYNILPKLEKAKQLQSK